MRVECSLHHCMHPLRLLSILDSFLKFNSAGFNMSDLYVMREMEIMSSFFMLVGKHE